mmetsp:Transcript_41659/g.73137  ORF Transcript_41659/g.73137 Transcript_41659/m.73137 type:complete len:358 (-) Transcript_41659:49-1122(-)
MVLLSAGRPFCVLLHLLLQNDVKAIISSHPYSVDIPALSLLQAGAEMLRAHSSSKSLKLDEIAASTSHLAAVPHSKKRRRRRLHVGHDSILNSLPRRRFDPPLCDPLVLPQEANWTEYLQAVYHEPLSATEASLDNFQWFFYQSNPLGGICKEFLMSAASSAPTMNAAWTTPFEDDFPNGRPFPIRKAAPYGFFVRRHPRVNLLKKSRVEVLHVASKDSANASWFWVVQGTGVFINLDKLRELGQVMELSNSDLWHEKLYHGAHPSHATRDLQVGAFMTKHKASAILLPGISHLPEFVVRVDNAAIRTSSCVLPRDMLSTGFKVPQPCLCNQSSELLNCDGNRKMRAKATSETQRNL